MQVGMLQPYERALDSRGPLGLITEDGESVELDIERFVAPVAGADHDVVARCVGPVLDVGCGPGRFVHELTRLGVAALGVDVAATAVRLSRSAGVLALQRSVFDPLPGQGRWPTVLLMDGNIGIGGDPQLLLERVAQLLRPAGRVIVETDDRDVEQRLVVRFCEDGRPVGEAFEWAILGSSAVHDIAARVGYSVVESWTTAGRSFVVLGR